MRQETPQEKAYHDMLSPDLGANAHVSFGHQENLRIIQTHLQTFYGQRADWSQCLKAYFQSRSHQASFCNSKCCEDIPDISVEQLYAMIQEGERYQDDVERFLRLNQQGEVEHIHNNQLRKINKKYSIDVAYSKVDVPAVARPMVTLPSDLLVEPDGNGGWVLVAGQGKDS